MKKHISFGGYRFVMLQKNSVIIIIEEEIGMIKKKVIFLDNQKNAYSFK